MNKITSPVSVPALKPRNPLVAASRFLRAGEHRAAGGALRQRAQRSLQRELDHLRTYSP